MPEKNHPEWVVLFTKENKNFVNYPVSEKLRISSYNKGLYEHQQKG
jgi:hypothetical protein